jgi:hypothetical protein
MTIVEVREFLKFLLKESPINRYGCFIGDHDAEFWATLEAADNLGYVRVQKPHEWDEVYMTITRSGFIFSGLRPQLTFVERLSNVLASEL